MALRVWSWSPRMPWQRQRSAHPECDFISRPWAWRFVWWRMAEHDCSGRPAGSRSIRWIRLGTSSSTGCGRGCSGWGEYDGTWTSPLPASSRFRMCGNSAVERAWFLNPDRADLATTEQWAAALSLSTETHFSARSGRIVGAGRGQFRCRDIHLCLRTHRRRGTRAGESPPSARTRRDAAADPSVHSGRLRSVPGLRRVQPLAARLREGNYFFQRFYDASSLRDRIFSVLGEPRQLTVYGESEPGYFGRNAQQKMRGSAVPLLA